MISKLFAKAQEVETFDKVYFSELCEKKQQLENRINNVTDTGLQDLLERQQRCVDAELNLIVVNEKKASGMNYHGDKAKRYNRNSKSTYKSVCDRTKPVFVNGEVI